MGDFDVDSDLVRKLAKLLEETGLGEIEYEADGRRIRVARPAPAGVAVPVASAADSAKPATAAEPAPGTNQEATHPGTVTSPMVGAVYLTPSPDDPPFITDDASQPLTERMLRAAKVFLGPVAKQPTEAYIGPKPDLWVAEGTNHDG